MNYAAEFDALVSNGCRCYLSRDSRAPNASENSSAHIAGEESAIFNRVFPRYPTADTGLYLFYGTRLVDQATGAEIFLGIDVPREHSLSIGLAECMLIDLLFLE